MMSNLTEQIEFVCNQIPSLAHMVCEGGYKITGKVILNAEYNNLPLYDEYQVEIFVPENYPAALPRVRELEHKIPEQLEHFYQNGELCLGALSEIADYLEEDHTVYEFIQDIVMSYLYTASYFRRYGEVPYGERSHGALGVEESFFERYHINNRKILAQLLLYLIGKVSYRGHHECPCGSGRKLRACHGRYILSDMNSCHYDIYRKDAELLLIHYIKELEEGGEL